MVVALFTDTPRKIVIQCCGKTVDRAQRGAPIV
jgi:hypothetical protein